MEIYCTKKAENAEDFVFDIPSSIPYIHIKTPDVIVNCDINGNFYIADCPNDNTFISNFIKFKKVMSKKAMKTETEKHKLQDDIIWIKPSIMMTYEKNNGECVKCSRILLGYPLSLQLSFRQDDLYNIGKPYNTFNINLTCDKIFVSDDFNWETILTRG